MAFLVRENNIRKIRMIKTIKIHKYRKLENISFNFENGINIISGTNGTCKTSLLHIISNSFKAPKLRNEDCDPPASLRVIKNSNVIFNPKIEALVRDAKEYVDPSNGLKGNLFEVEYSDNSVLRFRKHNSDIENRFAIKPYYGNTEERKYLPACPIIYLGLSRLFPTGEIDDESLNNVNINLPDDYLDKIKVLYKKLTQIEIDNIKITNVNNFKSGPEFKSSVDGIDSNTISSGEDNLFIILKALVSLSFYHDSIKDKSNDISSILLIDEFDATLHPSLQEKLFDILEEYAAKYSIQIIITTHSLSLLEYAIEKNKNVIYLLNNYTDVDNIENPTILDIKMYLRNEVRDELYSKIKIPIFMEDDEARLFFTEFLDYLEDRNKEFSMVRRFFHLVPCKIGADNLSTIFNDPYLLETTLKSICILDGDKQSDISKCTIALPGKESPEQLFFKYIEQLNSENNDFWKNRNIIRLGYTKHKYLHDIKPDIDSIQIAISEKKDSGSSSKGIERQLNKKIFNKHINFFRLVMSHWFHNSSNDTEIRRFYNNLKTVFKKVSIPNGIEKNEWHMDY